MIMMAQAFEKEYKNSDFYKATKMPLMEVIKFSKAWYAVQFEDILNGAQRVVDSLNFDNVSAVMDQFGELFTQENEAILSMTENLQDLLK